MAQSLLTCFTWGYDDWASIESSLVILRADYLSELSGLDLAQSRLATAKLSPSTAGTSKRAKKKKM